MLRGDLHAHSNWSDGQTSIEHMARAAVEIGHSAARWIMERSHGPYVLNINVPGVPIDEINGIHWADLDDFGYFRVANADVVDRKLQFVVGSSSAGTDPASDTALSTRRRVLPST